MRIVNNGPVHLGRQAGGQQLSERNRQTDRPYIHINYSVTAVHQLLFISDGGWLAVFGPSFSILSSFHPPHRPTQWHVRVIPSTCRRICENLILALSASFSHPSLSLSLTLNTLFRVRSRRLTSLWCVANNCCGVGVCVGVDSEWTGPCFQPPAC